VTIPKSLLKGEPWVLMLKAEEKAVKSLVAFIENLRQLNSLHKNLASLFFP
jgi:hypothetical protein